MWSIITRFLPSLASGVSSFFNPWLITAGLAVVTGAFLWGLHLGSDRLDVYIAKEDAVRAKQDAENAIKIAKQKAITEVISGEYEDKIADLQHRYAGWLPINSSGRAVPTTRCPAGSPDGPSSNLVPLAEYRVLAQNCTMTTLQLIKLQEWVSRVHQE